MGRGRPRELSDPVGIFLQTERIEKDLLKEFDIPYAQAFTFGAHALIEAAILMGDRAATPEVFEKFQEIKTKELKTLNRMIDAKAAHEKAVAGLIEAADNSRQYDEPEIIDPKPEEKQKAAISDAYEKIDDLISPQEKCRYAEELADWHKLQEDDPDLDYCDSPTLQEIMQTCNKAGIEISYSYLDTLVERWA